MAGWGGFLRLHTVLHGELDRRLTRDTGITLSTYDVLSRLAWAGDEGMRMGELCRQVMMTSGGLTRLADRLERDGLIARERCADDLRGYYASITPAGRKLLKRANRAHLAAVRELFLDHVSEEELRVLGGVWGRVMEAAGSEAPA